SAFSRLSWSPDGKALASTAISNGRRQIVLIEEGAQGWILRYLDGHPNGVRAGSLGWSPDEEQLAFLYPVHAPRDPAAPVRITRRFLRDQGQALVEDNLSGIAIADRSGSTRTLDIPTDWILSQPTFSPDGKHIAFKMAFDPADEAAGPSPGLCIADLATGAIRTLVDAGLGWIGRFAFIDAKRIALISSTFQAGT